MINTSYTVNSNELIIHFEESISKKKETNLSKKFILNDKYKISLEGKTKYIFDAMSNIDGTLKFFFDKNGYYDWKIPLPIGSRDIRFHSLLPLFLEDINISEILKDYQKEGINWLKDGKEKVLADDMGLGKSIQVIQAINEMYIKLEIKKFLIISPLTLVENWIREFSKWSPQTKFTKILNSDFYDHKLIRDKIFTSNGIIVNYEMLDKFNDYLSKENFTFDILVADEAHRIRKTNSKTHNEFCRINSLKKWLVTGTPFERNREDIEGILKALNKDNIAFLNSNSSDFSIKVALDERILRRIKKDVLKELPELTKKYEVIEMTKSQKIEYNNCLKSLTFATRDKKIGYIPKLLNISTMSENGDSSKLMRAIEIIQDNIYLSRRSVVFSYFNNPLHQLKKELQKKDINARVVTGELSSEDRDKIVDEFQTKKTIDSLLCNGKVASEGLTLTKASNVIFLNEAWNPSSNRQAEDRVNRIGQNDDINIYYLRSHGTIDEHLNEVLKNKEFNEAIFLKI